MGPADYCRTTRFCDPVDPRLGLYMSNCLESPRPIIRSHSRPRRETQSSEDGLELRSCLLVVLCPVPHHYAPGLSGQSQRAEQLRLQRLHPTLSPGHTLSGKSELHVGPTHVLFHDR